VKVGVTATQEGLSEHQKRELRKLLREATELHHGDCVGGDKEAHAIGRELGLRIVIHPPINPKKRAWCQGDEVRPEKDYLERNRDVVDETDVLYGLPKGLETRRSGTWSTIRYAKKRGKAYGIVHR
jgi:hypothetical protein